jgi:hypothetical protein
MAHAHKHSHTLPQEKFVARVFWLVITIYFLLKLFLKLNEFDLLGSRLVESGGMTLLWQAVTDTWLNWLGPVFITLNILCALVFLYSAYKVWPIRQKITIFKNPHAHGHGHGGAHAAEHGKPAAPARNPMVLKHWTDIVKRANTGTPENLRWAIMESDALVDFVLKERQLLGDTMADRLANFRRSDSKNIDKLWEAHKLRNEIAHTPGFKVTTKQAEKALFAYRDFLKELNAF